MSGVPGMTCLSIAYRIYSGFGKRGARTAITWTLHGNARVNANGLASAGVREHASRQAMAIPPWCEHARPRRDARGRARATNALD